MYIVSSRGRHKYADKTLAWAMRHARALASTGQPIEVNDEAGKQYYCFRPPTSASAPAPRPRREFRPAKERARDAFYSEARGYLMRGGRPVVRPNILVLGGPEPEREKATLDRIFRWKGARCYDVTCVERDPELAEQAREVYGSENVLEGELQHILAGLLERGPFHVLNLDFCGTLLSHRDEVSLSHKLQAPKALTAVWLCGRDTQLSRQVTEEEAGESMKFYRLHAESFIDSVKIPTVLVGAAVAGLHGGHFLGHFSYRGNGPMNVFVLGTREDRRWALKAKTLR